MTHSFPTRRSSDLRIELSAAIENGDLLIAVADNGPGIPAESRAAALRRFGRLDPARGRPGSGLGLSLVEAVARSEEHTSELQSLMRISYAVFCLKKKNISNALTLET